jgi:hypothetical protein
MCSCSDHDNVLQHHDSDMHVQALCRPRYRCETNIKIDHIETRC